MRKTAFLPLFAAALLSCGSLPGHTETAATAYREEGRASWYGGEFHGRKTANGEIFDTEELTAAHRTLPFGTLVRVENTANGKSVVVRINDRGPFAKNRIIDLSRKAASMIGMIESGTVQVVLTAERADMPEESYTLQVAAFGKAGNASQALGKLEEAGVNAVLIQGTDGIFRIVIPGISKDELEQVKSSLSKAGYPDPLVKRER